jgi:hypothetical protein
VNEHIIDRGIGLPVGNKGDLSIGKNNEHVRL